MFDTVKLNIGGGFRDLHGVFIAPESGLYLFSASIESAANGGYHIMDASIFKNSDRIAMVHAAGESSYRDQGSVTAVVQLEVDDEVWVRADNPSITALTGRSATSFTGFLIY